MTEFEMKQVCGRMHKIMEHKYSNKMYCSICDNLLFDKECLHFPGLEYIVNDQMEMCYTMIKT